MSRLIDADKERSRIAVILKESGEGINTKCFSGNDVIKLLNNAPTAYDIDKVVEQLEKLSLEASYHSTFEDFEDGKEAGLDIAIDVVKGAIN